MDLDQLMEEDLVSLVLVLVFVLMLMLVLVLVLVLELDRLGLDWVLDYQALELEQQELGLEELELEFQVYHILPFLVFQNK